MRLVRLTVGGDGELSPRACVWASGQAGNHFERCPCAAGARIRSEFETQLLPANLTLANLSLMGVGFWWDTRITGALLFNLTHLVDIRVATPRPWRS